MVALNMNIDPFAFLNTRDDFQRFVMMELADRAYKIRDEQDHKLAVYIRNQIADLLK